VSVQIPQLDLFCMTDYEQVIALWHRAGLKVGPSDSPDGIAQKLERDADLFLVARDGECIVGAVMGCYDGRRGWAYHLAVDPDYQGQGVGATLMQELEKRLRARGCIKVNLLVARSNASVQRFYQRLGFESDDVIFMQKWLE
jgi:ribosomal protein S18 acetylase RimI-like enzyme